MSGSASGKGWLALAILFASWFVAPAAHADKFSSHALHLRVGLHAAGLVQPPAGVAPPAAAAPAASGQVAQIAAAFAKMDLNKDGKVDVNEFVVADQKGILPLSGPGPAPAAIVAAPAAAAAVPAPSPAQAEEEIAELPPRLRKPPPLPRDIPEPPPPPRAPPPEPRPPPQPPMEGQLVGPPPSEDSLAPSNVTAMMANVPGLDLAGTDPVQAPNTPPPLPAGPPAMPRIVGMEQREPPKLPNFLMNPSPVAFGVDVAQSMPTKTWPLKVVSMPLPPGSSAEDANPLRASLLSLSSRRHSTRI